MKYSKKCFQFVLILSISTLITGCQQTSQSSQEITIKPTIVADCIVNYFQKDNAPYITQQQHSFDPSAGYLKITANEPTGTYQFTLIKEQFKSAKKPTAFLSGLPASFVNQPLAAAVFYSFTAGAGLLDTSRFSASENIKIEGQWYQPLLLPEQSGNMTISLLKNVDTNRIELVELSQTQTEKITDTVTTPKKWLLRSYNLRYSKDLNTLAPMKFDVFDICNGLASKQLIIQFEYKSILKKQRQPVSE